MRSLFLSILLFSSTLLTYGQTANKKKAVKPTHQLNVTKDLELACEKALDYYPTLSQTKIEFITKRAGNYTMMARPEMGSIFKRRSKRKYRIIINTNLDKSGIVASELPFNAKVGVLGHELAHIVRYQNQSGIAILWDGIRYVSKKFRAKYEKATDEIAIEHGVGEELHRYASYILYESHASWWFKRYKRKMYLTPQAIEEKMDLKLNTSKH